MTSASHTVLRVTLKRNRTLSWCVITGRLVYDAITGDQAAVVADPFGAPRR